MELINLQATKWGRLRPQAYIIRSLWHILHWKQFSSREFVNLHILQLVLMFEIHRPIGMDDMEEIWLGSKTTPESLYGILLGNLLHH